MNKQIALTVVAMYCGEHGRTFLPGQVVDFDETLGNGLVIGEHVRHDCFVPAFPAPVEAAPVASAHEPLSESEESLS